MKNKIRNLLSIIICFVMIVSPLQTVPVRAGISEGGFGLFIPIENSSVLWQGNTGTENAEHLDLTKHEPVEVADSGETH